MKTFCLIFCLGFCLNLKADLGSSVVYKAKFFLKNGEREVGYFEFSGYDREASLDYTSKKNRWCNDTGIYSVVKKLVKRREVDSVTIFKKIYYPKYFKETGIGTEKFNKLGAVAYKDVIKIAFKDINFTVFINVKENPRQWLTSELLITSLEIIEKLNTSKPLTVCEIWEEHQFPDIGFIFFNYNPKINAAEIERLYNLKQKLLLQYWEFRGRVDLRKYEEVKIWFWEKGIVVAAINGTC